LQRTQSSAEAVATYERVVEKARWLVRVDQEDMKARLDLNFALLRLGLSMVRAGMTERAIGTLGESTRALAELSERDAGHVRLAQNLAYSRLSLAKAMGVQKRWKEALALHGQASRQFQAMSANAPGDFDLGRMNLEALVARPVLLRGSGLAEQARQAADEAIRFAESPRFVRSSSGAVRAEVALAYANAADVWTGDKATEYLRRAAAEYQKLSDEKLLLPDAKAAWDRVKSRLP